MKLEPKPEGFIHFSQIATFLQCPKKHEFAYTQGFEPKETPTRMLFGTFGHARLADLWLSTFDLPGAAPASTTAPQALHKALAETEDPERVTEITETYREAMAVAERAFTKLHPRFKPYLYNDVLQIEQPLIVDVLGRPVGGTPDAILVDTNDNSVWIVDYKFRRVFSQPESENLNLQAVFYQALAAKLGINVLGTFQFQIKPALPKAPKLNKNGSMSKADVMSDWETYSAAVLAAGLDLADYEDMQEKLSSKVFSDLGSCRAFRSKVEIERVWQSDIMPAVTEIVGGAPRTSRCYFFKSCELCSYQELCIEDAKGGDTEWLLGTRYKKKGERGYLLPIIEED